MGMDDERECYLCRPCVPTLNWRNLGLSERLDDAKRASGKPKEKKKKTAGRTVVVDHLKTFKLRPAVSILLVRYAHRIALRSRRGGLAVVRRARGSCGLACLVHLARENLLTAQVLRRQYQKEQAQAHITVQTKFNYAWGLVKSPMREHQVEGVRLLQGTLGVRPFRRRNVRLITIVARDIPVGSGTAERVPVLPRSGSLQDGEL